MSASSQSLTLSSKETSIKARVFKNSADLSLFNSILIRGFELRIGLVTLEEPYLSLCITHFLKTEFAQHYPQIVSTFADSRFREKTLREIKKEFLEYITSLTAEDIRKLLHAEVLATSKYHTNSSFLTKLRSYFQQGIYAVLHLKNDNVSQEIMDDLRSKVNNSWFQIRDNASTYLSRRERCSQMVSNLKAGITLQTLFLLLLFAILSRFFIKLFLSKKDAQPFLDDLNAADSLWMPLMISLVPIITIGYALFKLNNVHKFIYHDEYSATALLDNICRRQFNQNQATRAQFSILLEVLSFAQPANESTPPTPESKEEASPPKPLKRRHLLSSITATPVLASPTIVEDGESYVRTVGTTTFVDVKEGIKGGAVVLLDATRHSKLLDAKESSEIANVIARKPTIFSDSSSDQGIKRNGSRFFFRTRGRGAAGAMAIEFRLRDLTSTEQTELNTTRTRAFSPCGRTSK